MWICILYLFKRKHRLLGLFAVKPRLDADWKAMTSGIEFEWDVIGRNFDRLGCNYARSK